MIISAFSYQSPSIWIGYIDIFAGCAFIGFAESMIAPFMQKNFDASQMEIGMTLFYMGASFMIVSPLFGIVSNFRLFSISTYKSNITTNG